MIDDLSLVYDEMKENEIIKFKNRLKQNIEFAHEILQMNINVYLNNGELATIENAPLTELYNLVINIS
jgi:hypothetical protein